MIAGHPNNLLRDNGASLNILSLLANDSFVRYTTLSESDDDPCNAVHPSNSTIQSSNFMGVKNKLSIDIVNSNAKLHSLIPVLKYFQGFNSKWL